jgi:C4-dicarboxylate-specific signal transduction histidine kinase
MTEVATGVLHNVGNVLNTVNLAVNGMRERLEQARFRHLRQAVALLETEKPRLAEFLTTDPRGQALPGFLHQLGSHFEAENAALLGEITRVIDRVDHIKEIISTQQSHARIIGVIEHAHAADLAEDAIKIAQDSLLRHRVTLTRRFQETDRVLVDRHKVVQILVNLIINGKDAIAENGTEIRHIEVSSAPASATHVAISVTDSGCGIAAANLPRLFRHGFTTKIDGHGFGLHMSALAAQEMRGALRAYSAGPGHGACFTLELPVSETAPSS